ncbi:MAG: L,D-transpeptidase family protein [Gammaproteobacteria bacterium]|nr:L,D-transpeptidase family protein [Gammaproteobacteria bacterium]
MTCIKGIEYLSLCLVINSFFVFPVLSDEVKKADFVVVIKSESKMLLKKGDNTLRTYKVAFGAKPQGHKQEEGDERTPEGRYILDYKKSDSAYYKAIHVSYPNEKDKEKARKLGVSPGGNIMIHGQRNGFGWLGVIVQWFDWTDGCIAVKNSEMDEIWQIVDPGTPIEIYP